MTDFARKIYEFSVLLRRSTTLLFSAVPVFPQNAVCRIIVARVASTIRHAIMADLQKKFCAEIALQKTLRCFTASTATILWPKQIPASRTIH